MYCPSCGTKCEENHSFCFHCGAPLPQTAPIELQKEAEISSEPLGVNEPETYDARETTPAAFPEASSDSNASIDSCLQRKGRLWPPFVLIALMIVVGLVTFFLTSSHLGTDSNMPWFQVKDGVLYFDAALYTGGSELTVPQNIGGQTVTALSDGCFARCDMLTTVVLPDTLKEIGFLAFAQCTSLRGIMIPENVVTIGEEAFFGCTALEAIRISGTVNAIGQQAFLGCQKLHYVFYSGTCQQWAYLYSGKIAEDTHIYCADGVYQYVGRS